MNARAAGLPIPTSSSISNNISESISSNDINKLPNINNNI
uniref:Uncharacterized protein n=1 Tax=Megaselia scalaris TaxID=36166 RepID=T1H2B1_MEGSC